MAAPQPASWLCAFWGIHFSWVPQPSSDGCMPSDRKPSTDQVLTKTSGSFGDLERWVSRSAMWMPLTPACRIRSAHSALVFGLGALSFRSAATLSSACLTKKETMPGLAPQQETAVVEPAGRAFLAASVASRRAYLERASGPFEESK